MTLYNKNGEQQSSSVDLQPQNDVFLTEEEVDALLRFSPSPPPEASRDPIVCAVKHIEPAQREEPQKNEPIDLTQDDEPMMTDRTQNKKSIIVSNQETKVAQPDSTAQMLATLKQNVKRPSDSSHQKKEQSHVPTQKRKREETQQARKKQKAENKPTYQLSGQNEFDSWQYAHQQKNPNQQTMFPVRNVDRVEKPYNEYMTDFRFRKNKFT